MPPHALICDFLPETAAEELLDWAIANEDEFVPTIVGVGSKATVDVKHRRSLSVRRFGPVEDHLRKQAMARAAELVASVKMNAVDIESAELELVAHGDGAHYGRHIDTFAASDGGARVLSAVYYAFRRPKGYSGGALRLHRFDPMGADEAWLDIEPEHNSLLVFPSWAPHEVRLVTCASGRFEDSRFAVNIWLCTRPKTTIGTP